ncbi:DUF3488 and transglutaminase-like domain-containing protein [Neptuniibacter sp.]|uniref:transglutaminase TgpA family protein n=1 Tax=Neptuniibacter sp. TaxID=1962643 RepID=UPI002638E6AD|nr:DUF3488 and transglutaminase-like domain-containing protein [Neptuniibacter sp.]MCP4596748.1 DUF3488 domain-containing transglutaminase family protein [Neptuniibacter sp.]
MKAEQLTRTSLLWQLLMVVTVLLPHLGHLPVWVPFLTVICLGWRLMVYMGRWSFPHWAVRAALVMITAVGVLISYRMGGGISVTVALLVVGFGLKTLEMYKRRDALVVIYVAYLVIATSFLFSQSVLMAVYVFLALLICTTALLSIYSTRLTSFWSPLRRCAFFMAPAIPLMVVLFIVMPRIGPLWEVGLDQAAAKTGLADNMSPGDISSLTRSAEVAFRVEFEDGPPQQSELYWRALVMNDFDGRTWLNLPGEKSVVSADEQVRISGGRKAYEIILEPNQDKYIPVLEQISQWPAELKINEDMTLKSLSDQTLRKQYKFQSLLSDRYSRPLNILDLKRQLILPEGNQRARRLARRWWQENPNREAFIGRILQYYNQSFTYSLQPPRLGDDDIDQFLFETQKGFCGHFSGATAFMLRTVGIPARIVAGYQGGEWNPYEGYLLVRQYDAHAWVEAWFEQEGWVRIDPTAYVAPERIERPSDETFRGDNQFLADSPLLSATIRNDGLLSHIRLRMEAFNYGWHRWVLGYHNQQGNFLKDILGAVTPLRLMLFLLIPFAVIITLTSLLILKRSRGPKLDPCDEAVFRLSQQLEKQGLQRAPGETVVNYFDRVSSVRSELTESLQDLGRNYEAIRYGQGDNIEQRQRFLTLATRCMRLV